MVLGVQLVGDVLDVVGLRQGDLPARSPGGLPALGGGPAVGFATSVPRAPGATGLLRAERYCSVRLTNTTVAAASNSEPTTLRTTKSFVRALKASSLDKVSCKGV